MEQEESNYYPFGLKHEGYNVLSGNPAYKYKYNGKELQETGMYDYGARFYMPDLGRWGVVDPLAEKYFNTSPFSYTANNPVLYIDLVFFAKTKEGKAFLSKYMEKGQKIEYGGKTIFEAKANGEFHNKGIDLSYGVGTNDNVGSETGGKMKDDRANVNILISRKAGVTYGETFDPKSTLWK